MGIFRNKFPSFYHYSIIPAFHYSRPFEFWHSFDIWSRLGGIEIWILEYSYSPGEHGIRFILIRDIHIPFGDTASWLHPFLAFQPRRGSRTEDTSQEWACPIKHRCIGDSWYSCKRFFLCASFVPQLSRHIPPAGIEHQYPKAG
jgi:hypothetical protein